MLIKSIDTLDVKKAFTMATMIFVPLTLFGFFIDQSVSLYFREQPNWMRDLAKNLTDLGLGRNYFIFFILLLTFSFSRPLKSFKKVREFAAFGLLSLTLSGLSLYILKIMVGRQRPYASENFEPYIFNPFTSNWQYHSMPSGHAQVVFATATVCLLSFRKTRWAALLIAVFLAWTRVATHNHFVSDVLVGGWIGTMGALSAVLIFRKWTLLHRVLNF